MACTLDLFTKLADDPAVDGGVNTTGSWSQGIPQGWYPGPIGTDLGDCENIITAEYGVEGVDDDYYAGEPGLFATTGGHLGTIDADSMPAGIYHYTYIVGDTTCISCTVVTLEVHPQVQITVGDGQAYCSTDSTPVNVWTEFFSGSTTVTGTVTGSYSGGFVGTSAWSYDGGTTWPGSADGDVQNDVFDPQEVFDSLGAGTYDITLQIQQTDGPPEGTCTNCSDIQTVQVTITAIADTGLDGTASLCNAL